MFKLQIRDGCTGGSYQQVTGKTHFSFLRI